MTALQPEGFDRNDLFLEEMRHFIRITRGEESPLCTLEDGLRTQRLVQEIYDFSAKQNNR
jgi:predicted dehydrogenase